MQLENIHALAKNVLRAIFDCPDETLFRDVLDVVLNGFQSSCGFFGQVDTDGLWTGACRTATTSRTISPTDPDEVSLDEIPVQHMNGVLTPESLSEIVLPSELHSTVSQRLLTAPIVNDQRTIGWLLIGGKHDMESETASQTLNFLASIIAPVLELRTQRQQQTKLLAFLQQELKVKGQDEQAKSQEIARQLEHVRQYLSAESAGRNPLNLVTQRSAQRFREVIDNTPAVIYVKNLDGTYQFINRTFEELFKVRLEDVQHKTDYDIFPPDLAAAFQVNDLRVARTGESIQVEEVALHDDGSHTYVSVKFPLRDLHGHIEAVAGISTDVTQRIKVQQYEQEFRAALEVQQILYPHQTPQLEGFEIAGRMSPAGHGCGDYLDFVQLPRGAWAFVVGDVSGHDLASALQMVETRAYLRALLVQGLSPEAVINQLNDWLFDDLLDGTFVELFLAILEPSTRKLTYLGAGHDAWVFHAHSKTHLRAGGPPLGLERGVFKEVSSESLELEPDDLLLMVTDGLVEARNDKGCFGWERTKTTVLDHHSHTAEEIISALFDASCHFSGQKSPQDDLTALAVKVVS